MIDLDNLRNNLKEVSSNLMKRGFKLDEVLWTSLEENRKHYQVKMESLQADQNKIAKEIAQLQQDGKESNEEKSKATKISKELKKVKEKFQENKVEYDKKVLAEFIMKYFPDFRRVLNELQRYSVSGKIDSGILYSMSEVNIKELMTALKTKQFNEMRKWVVKNLDKEPTQLFRTIYDNLEKCLDAKSIPQAILTLAGYQYKSAFVADQEINLLACLSEIMAQCKFK